MEDRAVSRRKMCCPRRISADGGTRFRYRKRKNQKRQATDGQNRIQNDTEQEEADIAGGETDKQAEAGNTEGDGTTLIFAGMYCLQTPLKATMMRAELKSDRAAIATQDAG